jgi:hypothetical protein
VATKVAPMVDIIFMEYGNFLRFLKDRLKNYLLRAGFEAIFVV